MTIENFIKNTFKEQHGYCYRPRIVCNDGFSMSVQGSAGHYCDPRITQDWYDSLEIGFPSNEETLINQYAENKNDWTNTVYGYVPIEIIQELITKHGGINVEETFKIVYI
jgi:hypothetical protein